MHWNVVNLDGRRATGDAAYGMHADDYPDDELDEKGVTVVGAIGTHDRFSYEYDFADGWAHEVVVETLRKIPRGPRPRRPRPVHGVDRWQL